MKDTVQVTAGTFIKGAVSALAGGVAMVLVSGVGQAGSTDMAVAGALLGGMAYLVGYCHGWDRAAEVEKENGSGGEQKAEQQ